MNENDELHYIYKMIGAYGFSTVKELLDKYNELDEANKRAIEYIKDNSMSLLGETCDGTKYYLKDDEVGKELLKILEGKDE